MEKPSKTQEADEKILAASENTQSSGKQKKNPKSRFLLVIIILLIGLGGYMYWQNSPSTKTAYVQSSFKVQVTDSKGSDILNQVASQKYSERAEDFMKQLPEERNKDFDNIWRTFGLFMAIPRASGNETEISKFVADIGNKYKELGLVSGITVDKTKNVIMTIPGNKAGVPKVLLQGHVDIVSQTEDPSLDPAKVGVYPVVTIDKQKKKNGDPNWWKIGTKGGKTTLGGDNGAMVSALVELPVLLRGTSHGDIRLVLTVGEEEGFTGAQAVDPKVFDGYSYLINIDMEAEKTITIGSAALGGTFLTFTVQKEIPSKNLVFKTLKVSGLEGGHSGLNIGDPNRENAIKLLAKILSKVPSAQIVSLTAEGPLNAIPKEATVTAGVTQEDVAVLENQVNMVLADIKPHEKNTAKITLANAKTPPTVLTKKSSENVVTILTRLPHAVSEWDPGDKEKDPIKKTVQTSTNLATAVLAANSNNLSIKFLSRSSFDTNLKQMRDSIEKVAKEFSGKVEQTPSFPAWEPVRDTKLSKIIQDVYKQSYPNMPQLSELITHGGLETSLFVAAAPHLKGNTVSIGPDTIGIHSVGEELNGPSFEREINLLLQVLTKMSAN